MVILLHELSKTIEQFYYWISFFKVPVLITSLQLPSLFSHFHRLSTSVLPLPFSLSLLRLFLYLSFLSTWLCADYTLTLDRQGIGEPRFHVQTPREKHRDMSLNFERFDFQLLLEIKKKLEGKYCLFQGTGNSTWDTFSLFF